jgi:hypothetical protein
MRASDQGWQQQRQDEHRIGRNKLLALAADCADLGLAYRLTTTHDGRPLMRVWEPRNPDHSVTLACANLAEGWSFCRHLEGVITPAARVNAPGDATHAAQRVADLLKTARGQTHRKPGDRYETRKVR